MKWLAVFLKDARLEVRSPASLGTLAMFVASALLLVRLALGREDVSVVVASALFWVVILFAATTGVGRAFVSEEERGTRLLLRLTVPSLAVYVGKLIFNVLLTLALTLITALGFLALVPVPVGAPGLLLATLLLGGAGLACGTTLLSAVLGRTRTSGPLLPVLAFPILIPLLLPLVSLTQLALAAPPGATELARSDLVLLAGYIGLTVSASVLLFEHVWKD